MHRLIAAVLGTGPVELFAQNSGTGLPLSWVVPGRVPTFTGADGSVGLRRGGRPPFQRALNSDFSLKSSVVMNVVNNMSVMFCSYTKESIGSANVACHGAGVGSTQGYFSHRYPGGANWGVLVQSVGGMQSTVPIGGGPYKVDVVAFTREANAWFVNVNNVKSATIGSLTPGTPTASGDTGVCAGVPGETWHSCFTAYWTKVLTASEIAMINNAARQSYVSCGGLAA